MNSVLPSTVYSCSKTQLASNPGSTPAEKQVESLELVTSRLNKVLLKKTGTLRIGLHTQSYMLIKTFLNHAYRCVSESHHHQRPMLHKYIFIKENLGIYLTSKKATLPVCMGKSQPKHPLGNCSCSNFDMLDVTFTKLSLQYVLCK